MSSILDRQGRGAIGFDVKKLFFDRSVIKNALDKVERKILSKVGAKIMTSARQSIRRRKKPSLPGKPPSAHKPGKPSLKSIFFSYDKFKSSVVVGPVLLRTSFRSPTGQTLPASLEFGGTVFRSKSKFKEKPGAPKIVVIEPRPFMGPPLEEFGPSVAELWKDTF